MSKVFKILALLLLCCWNSGDARAAIEVMPDVESGHIVEKVTWVQPEKQLHLLLRPKIPNHWFLFALKGVKDRQLTIEIEAQSTLHGLDAWRGVQPVMADSADISDPLLYDEAAYRARYDKLPWRRIENARYDGKQRTMTLQVAFETDEATIALKYPCPVSYVEKRLQQLVPLVAKNAIGIYQAGHPADEQALQLVTIPALQGVNAARWREKPVALIYGGEHGTEHESSQVVMGALEWLISDDPQAKYYRDSYNIILIPHLFPHETTISGFNLMTDGFAPNPYSVTGIDNELWARYFNQYIDQGHRVDVALGIMNTAGSETVNFYSALVNGNYDSWKYANGLNNAIMSEVQRRGWQVNPELGIEGGWGMRLAGWLGDSFGSNAIFYEVNGQKPDSQLSLTQVQSTGISLLQGAATYFESNLFPAQRALETERWQKRQRLKAKYPIKTPYTLENPPDWWFYNSFY